MTLRIGTVRPAVVAAVAASDVELLRALLLLLLLLSSEKRGGGPIPLLASKLVLKEERPSLRPGDLVGVVVEEDLPKRYMIEVMMMMRRRKTLKKAFFGNYERLDSWQKQLEHSRTSWLIVFWKEGITVGHWSISTLDLNDRTSELPKGTSPACESIFEDF